MIYIIIFVILLILSAFFSGAETAYFHLRRHRDITSDKVKSILEHPRQLLVSLLTGNTIVNVAIASLAAYLTQQYAQEHHWHASTLIFIEVIIVTGVVLIFGEILPKSITRNYANIGVIILAPFLKISYYLFLPVIIILRKTNGMNIAENLNSSTEEMDEKRDEIQHVYEQVDDSEAIEKEHENNLGIVKHSHSTLLLKWYL